MEDEAAALRARPRLLGSNESCDVQTKRTKLWRCAATSVAQQFGQLRGRNDRLTTTMLMLSMFSALLVGMLRCVGNAASPRVWACGVWALRGHIFLSGEPVTSACGTVELDAYQSSATMILRVNFFSSYFSVSVLNFFKNFGLCRCVRFLVI